MALTNTVTALTVLETEKHYWQATQDRDFETMRQLTGELLVLVQVEGIASFNRRDFARHDPRGRLSTARVEIDEDSVQSRMLGDGACFVAYRVPQDFERGGEAGSSVSHNTSVLVKGDVGWQRVARTISLA